MQSFLRQSRQNLFLVGLAVAYAITWIGGWYCHRREIAIEAQRRYSHAQALNSQMHGAEGYEIELRRGGPQHGVDWCFPVLPGIVLADSFYVIGPVYGKGGLKVVLFYGFGTVTLVELFVWIS